MRQNIFAWIIVWCLVLLSLALTAATFVPQMSTATIEIGLIAGVLAGIGGGAVAVWTGRRNTVKNVTRGEDREDWRTPDLAALDRPIMSTTRRMGLLTLRGDLLLAVILVVVEVVQAGLS